MLYKQALQAIDPLKALNAMGLNPEVTGSYLKFDCFCGKKAMLKLFGVKKNLWYCPDSKHGGNIISLYIKQMGVEYKDAVRQLVQSSGISPPPVTEELSLTYNLVCTKEVKNLGIDEEFCKQYEIGVPKGKTMLSGCLTFLIRNEEGKKIAYYGLNLKSGKQVFAKSFNPELYLYNFHRTNGEAILVTSFYDWIRFTLDGKTAICNFSLPYLSDRQQSLIQQLNRLTVYSCEMLEFIKGFGEITLSK